MIDSARDQEKSLTKINKDITKTSSTGRLSAMPNLTPTRHTIADPSQLNSTNPSSLPKSSGFNHYESRVARM